MQWNVKNEMPSGSAIRGTGRWTLTGISAQLALPTRNVAYLKTASTTRSIETAAINASRRRAPSARSMRMAAVKLMPMDASSPNTNHGSPQA